MASGKDSSNTRRTGKKKCIFMRLIDWIAKGADNAGKAGGHCST